jgi:hypothetical protein
MLKAHSKARVEDDEAFGRIAATKGIIARDRTRPSTIVALRIARRRQVELPQQRV